MSKKSVWVLVALFLSPPLIAGLLIWGTTSLGLHTGVAILLALVFISIYLAFFAVSSNHMREWTKKNKTKDRDLWDPAALGSIVTKIYTPYENLGDRRKKQVPKSGHSDNSDEA